MQKRRLFITLAAIITISLIGLSAQCGVDTEDKIDIIEESDIEETPIDSDDKDTAGSEDGADSEEGADEADSEGDDTYLEVEAPTITLGIYDGPIYSGADDICYYRIEASVTGSPTISFSKDDSGGAWGPKKVQINLNDPSDTYTLIATATNSEGSATDSIILSWGCDGEEVAEDGGEGSSMDIISITPDLYLSGIIFENGTFFYTLDTLLGPYINAGDGINNMQVKAYVSFDIRELHGKTVQNAEISIVELFPAGHPESFASTVDYKAFNFGDSLDAGDFAVGGTILERIPILTTSYTISGDTLKSELQIVLDDPGRDYFQIKLGLNRKTNGDGIGDVIRIDLRDAGLHIRYSD